MRAVAVIDKICNCCMYLWLYVYIYLQTAKASPLRPIGDVTEAETHQAADVEVMGMHQCK